MIKKVLIANRGEIARRIIKTAREMGIESVALCTTEEAQAPWVNEADEFFIFQDTELSQTYLNINKIIEVARLTNADAIHPGYGFLSENAIFAKHLEEAGITFVGPVSDSIDAMGNKLNASEYAEKAGVPVQKIHKGSKIELLKLKKQLQYPVLIKAAAGGGGKGMKKVYSAETYEQALEQTAREAKAYFGNDSIYVERLITNARHIEVQIIGDGLGNAIHLGERDCSMQRRHQKVIEEAPACILTIEQRNKVTNYAINLAKAMKYRSAGTVEFLFDENGDFWFLEMNTRIQVEHPVSEMITGFDIVRMQFEIAAGLPLSVDQNQIEFSGHAIEARLYAEKPQNDFLPAAGPVHHLEFPSSDWIRIDSSMEKQGVASPNFDPMIAKISVWGSNRDEAISRMKMALAETKVAGVETNREFLFQLIDDDAFYRNEFSTQYIEDSFQFNNELNEFTPFLAAHLIVSDQIRKLAGNGVWNHGYYRQIPLKWNIKLNGNNYEISWTKTPTAIKLIFDEVEYQVFDITLDIDSMSFIVNNKRYQFDYFKYKSHIWVFDKNKTIHTERLLPKSGKQNQRVNGRQLTLEAPMFGKVLSINTPEGTDIKEGDTLLVIESMKMENHLQATGSAKVKSILVHEGDQVADGQILMEFE
jgi:3-methylcrotonyl-CoA carboxylase alpha subunit